MIPAMELYQLRSFVAVAEEMHISRAAARLHLAQPTLSRQIAALERALGVPLFRRIQRRLQLTSAGQVFLTSAREILRRTESAAQQARRAARGEVGSLRLGFVQSAVYAAVPRLIRQFRTTCPEVQLEAAPMTTLQQIPALRAGEIDIGWLRPQQPSTETVGQAGLRTRVLSRDSVLAVLPSTHPLAARRRIPLAALANEPFILYPREPGSTGHDMIIEYCRQAGYRPRILQEATDAQTIVALVAANLGVSLLLGPTPPIDPSLVVYRPLSDRLPSWEMVLAWREDNPSATLARFLTVTAETGRSSCPKPTASPRSKLDAATPNDGTEIT
jgi:DNA-binding transcriptional LysR family regulator